MNPDILFNILLHCDIDTIQSFSCVKKKFLLSSRFSPKQRNYFWKTKFNQDGLKLLQNKGKTIGWINEYKKVFILTPLVNDMVAQLLSLNTVPWSGIFLYINNPINLGKIIPKAIHHRHFNAEHKVSFTRVNGTITLHNHLFTQRGTKREIINY